MNYSIKILEFLNKFKKYKNNRKKLTLLCQEFYDFDACKIGLDAGFKIELIDGYRFGKIASVDKNKKLILINFLRLVILEKYQIESDDDKFDDWISNFVKNFESNNSAKNEKIVYDTIVDPNWKDYISRLGNFKYACYELVHAMLHANAHIVQDEIIKKINDKTFDIKASGGAVDYFVCEFARVYNFLRRKEKLDDYERKNEYFAPEIYANIRAFEIIKNYADENKDEVAIKYLKFNDVIQISKKEYSKKIVSDFEKLMKTAMKIDEEFVEEFEIFKKHKLEIEAYFDYVFDFFKAL